MGTRRSNYRFITFMHTKTRIVILFAIEPINTNMYIYMYTIFTFMWSTGSGHDRLLHLKYRDSSHYTVLVLLGNSIMLTGFPPTST